jgi:hypothetical protein
MNYISSRKLIPRNYIYSIISFTAINKNLMELEKKDV